MKKNESRAESSRIEQSHVYVELLKRRHRRGVEISFRVGRFFLESSLLTAELLSILIRFRFPSITASLFRRRRKARYKPKKREIKAIGMRCKNKHGIERTEIVNSLGFQSVLTGIQSAPKRNETRMKEKPKLSRSVQAKRCTPRKKLSGRIKKENCEGRHAPKPPRCFFKMMKRSIRDFNISFDNEPRETI